MPDDGSVVLNNAEIYAERRSSVVVAALPPHPEAGGSGASAPRAPAVAAAAAAPATPPGSRIYRRWFASTGEERDLSSRRWSSGILLAIALTLLLLGVGLGVGLGH